MGDTYGKAQEQRIETGRAQRGKALLEMQALMTEDELKRPDYFPEWLHALVRREGGENEDADSEWRGPVMALRSALVASTKTLEEKHSAVERRLERSTRDIMHMTSKLEQQQTQIMVALQKLRATR